jgi:hypothetical protein
MMCCWVGNVERVEFLLPDGGNTARKTCSTAGSWRAENSSLIQVSLVVRSDCASCTVTMHPSVLSVQLKWCSRDCMSTGSSWASFPRSVRSTCAFWKSWKIVFSLLGELKIQPHILGTVQPLASINTWNLRIFFSDFQMASSVIGMEQLPIDPSSWTTKLLSTSPKFPNQKFDKHLKWTQWVSQGRGRQVAGFQGRRMGLGDIFW